MKSTLPFVQLLVGLVMLPQAFLFAALGLVPILRDTLKAHPISTGDVPHACAGWVASISVDSATVLSLICAVSLMRQPLSLWGTRLSFASTICYGIYVASHLAMISTLPGGLRTEFTRLDAIDYPVLMIAGSVAFALQRRRNLTTVKQL